MLRLQSSRQCGTGKGIQTSIEQNREARNVSSTHICSINFLKFICLIQFWLHWVFVAARGLSLVAASRATLHCGAWASHCSGFSCCGARALSTRASVVVEWGLSSCGSPALECSLSSCGAQAQLLCGTWDLPSPCPLHWQADS